MKKLIVLPDITIKEAFKILSNVGEKCLIVADENKIILGTLSDGDLRNAILKGVAFTDSVQKIFSFSYATGRAVFYFETKSC